MRQLQHDYVHGLPEIFSFVIPYVEGNGYTSLEHYIDCMRRPVNKSPDRDRSWGDAVAIQWAAKAFKIKINLWDEGSVATPPISASFDYSGDIMYRVVDLAHITMNGMVEHYEPIVPSPIAPVHAAPTQSRPDAKKAAQLVVPILPCKPYMRPATFSIAC